MSFRNNNMNRRDNRGGNGNFDRNNYGGAINRNMNINPWDNGMGGGRQGGGGPSMMNQGGGGGYNNADVLSLANNLVNNFLRNQGPMPSLLDLPPNDMRGGGGGNNYGGGRSTNKMDVPTFIAKIGNRSGGNNRNINNRRPQGGGGVGGGIGARKGGVRKPNSKDRAKNVLAKNTNSSKKDSTSADNAKSKTESDDKENGQNRKGKLRDSAYSNLPNDLFYCHMCMKHMWDSTSFENHIKGRSHQMMKEGIEESYRLRANMIRQEAKIMEQLKGIEIDRMKRMGKNLKASNQHRDYCTMCDLHFYGNLTNHRKTDGHVNLKKFLHPRCTDCSIEYPNRTDFDDHLLSPDHMAKVSKKASRFDKTKKNQLQILTEADELPGLKPKDKKGGKTKAIKKEGEDLDKTTDSSTTEAGGEKGEAMETENGEAAENAEDDGGDGENKDADEEGEKPAEEPEDVILDFVDGQVVPVEVDPKVPKYNHLRPLASSMIARLECYECRLCNRFFDTEKTAEIHSRTIYHYRQFTKFLNEKANETRIAQRRAEAAAEEEERRKRQKLEDEEAELNTTVATDKMEESAELYDPSEATADDDDKMEDSTATNGNANGHDTTAEIKEEKDVVEEEVSIVEPVVEATEEPEVVVEAEAKVEEPETPTKAVEEEIQTPQKETVAAATPTKQQPQRNQNNRSGGNRNQNNRNNRGGRGRYNRY